MLANERTEELLILVKTYPQPSSAHRETTCVAAVNRGGHLRRIFPVPFRLLVGEARFKKWEWTRVRIRKAEKDHRPESYKIDTDSIERLEAIGSRGGWRERRQWIEPHIVESFTILEQRRQHTGETLGIIPLQEVLGLDITPERAADWTEEEKLKLNRECLFDDENVRNRIPLRKLPFAFHYRYRCHGSDEIIRHRITDWEAGALYWNCVRDHGPDWEKPFRQKMESELPSKDLMFLMGTIHRFPDQWLIVGLIYPQKIKETGQKVLNFE